MKLKYTYPEGREIAFGVLIEDKKVHFGVEVSNGRTCSLLLYEKGQKKPFQEIELPAQKRFGHMASVTVEEIDLSCTQYNYRIGNEVVQDPYAQVIYGREVYGKPISTESEHEVRCGFYHKKYDWEGDTQLKIPYENVMMYCLHTRGFTKHPSSKVTCRGTFAGVAEKIEYLKRLGINHVQLMPSYEFNEVMEQLPAGHYKRQEGKEKKAKINYWGYTKGNYFAPKASYAASKDPVTEFKDMVKAFHQNGIEVSMEFFFPEDTNQNLISDCLMYWVREYHVDGFVLKGSCVPMKMLAQNPMLAHVKLMSPGFDLYGLYKERPLFRNVGEYNDGFQNDARRFLKGDEEQVETMVFRMKRNPDEHSVINYITNQNGFTLFDLVSYDEKHNEANGEENKDGTNYNYSWNCGAEGISRKQAVQNLRKKQIKNALMMLFLSQGTPMLLAGDEFGHSKKGNNNSYCQDNEVSWLNWNVPKAKEFIFEFVKKLIALRKCHPILHMPQQFGCTDYIACGYPDLSYHSGRAWYQQFENYRREIAMMYCGKYALLDRKKEDDFFYLAFNMHWISHKFALPTLPKGKKWVMVVSTDTDDFKEEKPLKDQRNIIVPDRTTVVLKSI